MRKFIFFIAILSVFYPSFSQSGMDSLMLEMNKNKHVDSTFTEESFQNVEKKRSESYKHLAVTAGCWIPSGKLAIFGVHPEVGLTAGFKYKRWNCGMNVNVRFLKTTDPYQVQRYDNMEESRRFNAVNVGLEAGYDLLYLPKHKIAVLGGIGYEGFNALKRDNAAGLGPVNINTYNIDFGAAYTFYVNPFFY